MFTPLPLRLWCMANMAPALTEAASQARAKLSNSREGSNTAPSIVTRRAITPTSLEGVVAAGNPEDQGEEISPTQVVNLSKELLATGVIETKQGTLERSPSLHIGQLKDLEKVVGKTNNNQIKSVMNFPNMEPSTTTANKQVIQGSTTQATVVNGIGLTGHVPAQQPPVIRSSPLPTSNVPDSTFPKRRESISSLEITDLPQVLPCSTNSNITMTQTSTSANVKVRFMATAEVKPDISKRQRDIERRAERILRRLRRLQSRQAVAHIKHQLSGFVDHQHKNLQTMAKSMKSPNPSASVDLKTELLQSEDVKSLSTAALVTLVRKLQSSQALSLRQRLAHQQATNEGGSSVLRLDEDLCMEMNRVAGTLQMNLGHLESALDSDATESSSGGESCDEDFDFDFEKPPRTSLKTRAEWKWSTERSAVAARWTWLQAQVSDLEYRIRQQSDIYRQIRTTKGAVTLGEPPPPEDLIAKYRQARTGKKLSPLEEKIANLERKNEMSPCNLSMLLSNVDKQSSRLTKQLGNVYSPAGSPMVGQNKPCPGGQTTPNSNSACSTPSKLAGSTPNGLVEPSTSQGTATPDDSDIEGESAQKRTRTDGPPGLPFDPPSPAQDNTCQAARCRPVRSYGKRKLLRTRGVHQLGRKAARLSTVRCQCFPPTTQCAMCGGRYNNTLTVDPDTMPLSERVSLLDSSYHPVLSFSHDVSLPIHFEALLKSGEWKHKPPPKQLKPVPAERRRKLTSGMVTERVRKYNKRLSKSASAAMLSSAKIRSKYVDKQGTRSGSSPSTPKRSRAEKRLRTVELKRKRKAALQAFSQMHKRELMESYYDDDDSPMGSPSLSHSLPSSTFRDMRAELKRRRGESAYDINNIVIPYSMAASTRVEKLQYKEILTPKWREVTEDRTATNQQTSPVHNHITHHNVEQGTKSTPDVPPVDTPPSDHSASAATEEVTKPVSGPSAGDNGIIIPKPSATPDSDSENEDVSDEIYADRHMRCEILEKKKFSTFQNSQRRTRNRHDSNASGNTATPATPGPATPGPATPGTSMSLIMVSEVERASSPLTTELGLTEDGMIPEETMRRRSGSCSSRTEELREEARGVNSRRRTGSVSASSSGNTPGPGRGRGRSQSTCDVEIVYEVTYHPWEERNFPLDDVGYEQLFKESPYGENAYVPRATRRTTELAVGGPSGVSVEGVPGTPQTSRPCSPAQSSSSSTIIEDDPNDPEWTVVSESEGKAERRPSIVLKLAKR